MKEQKFYYMAFPVQRDHEKTAFALCEGVFGNIIQKLRKLMQKKPCTYSNKVFIKKYFQ